MRRTAVPRRFYVEIGLAILATGLGVLTIGRHDWIEELTGLDPDAASGTAEWLIVAGLFLVAAVCALLACRDYLSVTVQHVAFPRRNDGRSH
jgi:hypothetical protein